MGGYLRSDKWRVEMTQKLFKKKIIYYKTYETDFHSPYMRGDLRNITDKYY